MRGWRQKKNDDFEWHKYVRTTIKLRREQRRETVEQVKKSAASGAKSAARRMVNFGHDTAVRSADWLVALSGATWRAAIAGANWVLNMIGAVASWTSRAALKLLRAIGPSLRKIWHFIRFVSGKIATVIATGAAPVLALLSRPMIRAPLGLVGVLAGTAALWRWFGYGFDAQAKIALMVGAGALSLSYGPALLRAIPFTVPFWLASFFTRLAALRPAWAIKLGRKIAGLGAALRLPNMPTLPTGLMRGAGAAVVVAGLAGLGWAGWSGASAFSTPSFSLFSPSSYLPSMPSMPSMPKSFSKLAANIPLIGGPEPITGRARVLSGDIIRIGRKPIRLAGIEAPELQQRCRRDRRRRTWRCGYAARNALIRLVRRKRVRCEPDGTDDAGRLMATCFAGKVNINARMVAKGYAFAKTGFMASYSAQEEQARKNKAGIWRGKALRPAQYRTKVWNEAKRRAPDGCPIKGNVTRAGKFYVLPWAGNYRRVRITKSRGERWFCSESAARAAGWHGAGQS